MAPILLAGRVAQLYALGVFPGMPMNCARCKARVTSFVRHVLTCHLVSRSEAEKFKPLEKLATHQYRSLAGKETIPALLIQAASIIGGAAYTRGYSRRHEVSLAQAILN